MAETGRWGGHIFEISPTAIRGFTGLQLRGSAEVEERQGGMEKFVARTGGNPTEINLTVRLHALVGCNVRDEALAFVEDARAGRMDYCYIGNKKLLTCQLMLTDASVREIAISGDGTWVSAEVQLTMKQASHDDGSFSYDAPVEEVSETSAAIEEPAPKKASVKKTSTKAPATTSKKTDSLYKKVESAAKSATKSVASGIKALSNLAGKITSAAKSAADDAARASGLKAVSFINSQVANAKKATATKKGNAKSGGTTKAKTTYAAR